MVIEKVLSHKRKTLEECISEINSWKIEESIKKDIILFTKEYSLGRITKRMGKNTNGLVESITNLLRLAAFNIKKFNEENIKKFYEQLLNNKVRSFNRKTNKFNGATYSIRYKIEALTMLKRYLTWKYPTKPNLASCIDIRIQKSEPDIDCLNLNEINLLYKFCRDNKERYIIAGLFATGTRAEEFINFRVCDYELPKKDEFIKATIRNETSKTRGRTISLHYDKTFEAIPEYMAERRRMGALDTDFVLTDSAYSTIRNLLERLGKLALKKAINAHMIRHSTATWLASKLNRQQLCYYFGWAFSSNMPDKYISRAGMNMQDADEKAKISTLQELQSQIEKERFEKRLIIENVENLQKESVEIRKQLEEKKFEAEKLDAFFNRAIEDPKFVSKFKKAMESSLLKDIIKEANLSKEDGERAYKSMKKLKWKSDKEYEAERILLEKSKTKNIKRSEGVNVIRN